MWFQNQQEYVTLIKNPRRILCIERHQILIIITTLFWVDSIFDKYINFQYGPL